MFSSWDINFLSIKNHFINFSSCDEIMVNIVISAYELEYTIDYTAEKMKFPIKDFFNKCEIGHIYWRNP